jgi:hypothetical protein
MPNIYGEKTKLYRVIASSVDARIRREQTGNTSWYNQHKEVVDTLIDNYFPSGSGFDSGCSIDWDKSKPNHLIFYAPYHRMDETGMYCGWIDVTIHVYANLARGYELRITGGSSWDKDYFYQVFSEVMDTEV